MERHIRPPVFQIDSRLFIEKPVKFIVAKQRVHRKGKTGIRALKWEMSVF